MMSKLPVRFELYNTSFTLNEERRLQHRGVNLRRRQFFTVAVLDQLIIKELINTLLSVWSVIVVIIVSREFIRVLDKAIDGRVPSETLLTLLALKTLTFSVSLLPAAVFMAVLMVIGRLYRDQEMAAIASAGGGAWSLYRAVLLMVIPLTTGAAVLSLVVSPWAEATVSQIMSQGANSSDLRGIAAGKFSEYTRGDLVFYVEKITDDKIMQQVFVQSRQAGELAIITAKTAQIIDQADGVYVVFAEGERTQGQPGQLDFVLEKFKEYAVRMEVSPVTLRLSQVAVPTAILMASTKVPDCAELQKRLAIPVSCLLLSFIAVPLAQQRPRGGVYGSILLGFLIYFSYGNLIRLLYVWEVNAAIPLWLGGLVGHVLLGLIGALLLARWYGWHWLMISFRKKFSV